MAEDMTAIQNELFCLQAEYVKLQGLFNDLELKYRSTLASSCSKTEEDVDGVSKFLTRLQDTVASLFNNHLYSDLVILMEDGHQLNGHKLILSARSDDWGVKEQNEYLDLRDNNYEVAYALIKWIYTDNISLKMEDTFLIELLQLATRFKLDSLNVRCQKALINCVNIKNCNKIYQISEENSCELLKDFCLEFISERQWNVDIDKTNNQYKTSETKQATESKAADSSETIIIEDEIIVCDVIVEEYETDVDDVSKVKTMVLKVDADTGCDLSEEEEEIKNSQIDERLGLLHHRYSVRSKSMPDVTANQCSVCGKRFRNQSLLCRHVRTHIGIRPFKCGVCSKTYCSKGSLVTHEKIHEMPVYMCIECDKTFNNKYTLMIHKKTHSGVKPYVCDTCGKSFTQISSLNSHMTQHKGKIYKCDVCDKTFIDRSTIYRHKKLHSGVKPFKCKICGKSFAVNGNLKNHMESHIPKDKRSEVCYACCVCNKRFIHRTSISRHLKKAHNISGIKGFVSGCAIDKTMI